jgi:hypothetical protein
MPELFGRGSSPVSVSMGGAEGQLFQCLPDSDAFTPVEGEQQQQQVEEQQGPVMSPLIPLCLSLPEQQQGSGPVRLGAWVPARYLAPEGLRWEGIVAGSSVPLRLVHLAPDHEPFACTADGCSFVWFEVELAGTLPGQLHIDGWSGPRLVVSRSALLLPAEHAAACDEILAMMEEAGEGGASACQGWRGDVALLLESTATALEDEAGELSEPMAAHAEERQEMLEAGMQCLLEWAHSQDPPSIPATMRLLEHLEARIKVRACARRPCGPSHAARSAA